MTYRSTNYNDYGSPWEVRAYDEGNTTYRLTSTTYQYGFTPWIVGRVASATYQHHNTADQGTTTYSYNLTTGFLTSATVLGVTTTFAPTAQGNVASVTDALSHQTTFEYSWGVVNVITPPTVPPPGVTPSPTTRVINSDGTVASETVGGLQTTYTYDALMRLGSVQPPVAAGVPVEPLNILRDSLHSRQETHRRGGNLPNDPHYDTVTDLDSFGRPRRVTDPAGLFAEMSYDACGRQTFTRRPSLNGAAAGIETTYDPLGRVTQVKDLADNSITTTTYDVQDGSDVVDVRVTDAEGKTTKYVSRSFGGPGGPLEKVIDADLKITTYTYNRLGTMLSATGPGTVGAPGPVRTWVVGTPANGRVTSATEPEGGTTTFQYNALGQVTSTTDALTQTFGLQYDTNNRLTFRDAPGTDADLTFEYDALGRLWRQTVGAVGSGSAIVTITGFDAVGRLSSRADAVDGYTFTSTYTYDRFDRPTTLTYPRPSGTGRAVTYGYDAASRLSSVTQGGAAFAGNFTYDNEGRLWRVDTGVVRHDLTFDARSRASHLTLSKIGAAAELDLTYAYNRVSHVTGVTDTRPGQSQTYDYDVLYRLKRATGPWGTVDWTYDATGNRLTETRNGVQTTDYTYNGLNRLWQTLVGGTPTETLQYDAMGRTTTDGRGTYGYFADGPVQSVTTWSGTTATYAYDAEGWRIKRVENGKTTYTLRSPGQQTLSTFELQCGTLAWQRDEIYAAGRLLGAVRTTATAPTVRFAVGTSSVTEPDSGTTSHSVGVVLETSTALTCPVTVNYETVAGSATGGVDYVAASGTLTFPIGSTNGALQWVPLSVRGDTLPEANEEVVLLLRSPAGAALIQPTDHGVTITNTDTVPTISTSNLTVGEAGNLTGYAQFTVTLNKTSEQTITVNYATANGTALTAATDYTATSGVLTFDPGQTSKTINVAITDDSWAEPTETFTFTLSSPTNATLGTAVGTASITDNDGTRVPLDLTLNGVFLSDLDASGTTFDHLLIANPQASPISAKVTYTRPNGTGDSETLSLIANERRTMGLSGSTKAAAGPVSIAVQSLTTGTTVEADHAQYWKTDWDGGRSTEGVPGSDTWYFAEGSVGYFEEYLTVHNLEPQAIQVVFTFYRSDGSTASHTATIYAGPGRLRLKVRDLNLSLGDHGTKVVATRLDTGAPAKVVAERTMEWETDRREGHSTPGTASLSSAWQFAEGNKGGFDTYLAFLNPSTTSVTARVLYRHENLVDYAYDVAVPAHARATLLTPPGVPDGGFALSVTVLEGVPITVERMLYGGDAWTVGTAGVGSIGAGTTWRFSEGITTPPFDTYFQVLNLGFSTTVTFTFVTEGGATITQGLWVLGGGGRAVLLADGVSGLSTGSFKTTVTSSQPVVVERATYWAAVGGSSLMAGGGAGLESVALDDGTAAVAKGGGGGGGSGPQRPWYHDLTKP
ncbi:MAG: Calx-beta domain-containing protein [Vicinamibacterales bacterium]